MVSREDLIFEQGKLSKVVLGLFEQVNRKMVEVIENEKALKALLSDLSSLFFINQTHPVSTFINDCKDELTKSFKDIDQDWIQNKFDLLLSSNDDIVKCSFVDTGLYEQLLKIITNKDSEGLKLNLPKGSYLFASKSVILNFLGIDLFTLNYELSFPLNLVVPKSAISKYQIIFRHLFGILNISNRLSSKKQLTKLPSAISKLVLFLRQQMVAFIQNLHCYLIQEVLQPQLGNLLKNLPMVYLLS